MSRFYATALLKLLLVLAAAPAFGQFGTLDQQFGNSGVVIQALGTGTDDASSVAIQPDGKIVLAGKVQSGSSTYDFGVLRLLPDGTLDSSFATNGFLTTAIGTGTDEPAEVLIQPDGKILVAGLSNNGNNYDFALVRYLPDGTLDNTFNGTGKVIQDVNNSFDFGSGIALQADGKIVMTGYSFLGTLYEMVTMRFLANGTLDPTFGTAGIVTTPAGPGGSEAHSVAIQSDGKILVAGAASPNGLNYAFALVRYFSNGVLDSTFTGNGIVITPVGPSSDGANRVIVQPDGKIVLVGFTNNTANNDFAITRYHSTGLLDMTFNATGMTRVQFPGNNDVAFDAFVQADGKIVAGGFTAGGGDNDFALARLHVNGSRDSTFGTAGVIITDIGSNLNICRGIAAQADGKIVAVGTAFSTKYNFAAVRYLPGPILGMDAPEAANMQLGLAPNPVESISHLSFTMQEAGTVSIHLADLQGRIVKTYAEQQDFPQGNQEIAIQLPDELPAGVWMMVVETQHGIFGIRLLKQSF